MKRLPLIVTAATFGLMTLAPADARSIRMMPGQNGMRVSASFQTIVPLSGQTTVKQEAEATEGARRSLYEIASRECDVITKVFKGTCKIVNLNVRSYVQDRGNGIRQISVSANASYLVSTESDNDDNDGKKL